LTATTRKLESRVALVTGGASGIGRVLSEKLAADGASVVVADINVAGTEKVAVAIRQREGRAEAAQLDVSLPSDVDKLVNAVVATHGRLDYMFNNAAVAVVGELRDGNLEDFRRAVDMNLFGVVHGTMAAYRVICGRASGTS
jgi:NAD(P)-dependent dehydrogenase (short-subunit alcohol dehydrogenase family)